jgi:hypothetical protein
LLFASSTRMKKKKLLKKCTNGTSDNPFVYA